MNHDDEIPCPVCSKIIHSSIVEEHVNKHFDNPSSTSANTTPPKNNNETQQKLTNYFQAQNDSHHDSYSSYETRDAKRLKRDNYDGSRCVLSIFMLERGKKGRKEVYPKSAATGGSKLTSESWEDSRSGINGKVGKQLAIFFDWIF